MLDRIACVAARRSVAVALFLMPGQAAFAQDLCGRPAEQPQALFDRLTKTEKLKEDFRDKSYVAISDKAKDTIWTFTVPAIPRTPRRLPPAGSGWRRTAIANERSVQCLRSRVPEAGEGFPGAEPAHAAGHGQAAEITT